MRCQATSLDERTCSRFLPQSSNRNHTHPIDIDFMFCVRSKYVSFADKLNSKSSIAHRVSDLYGQDRELTRSNQNYTLNPKP